MWIIAAFFSAAFLGLYDVAKKHSLRDNAVLPVLMINTAICASLFLPLIVGSALGLTDIIPTDTTRAHLLVVGKSLIVLASWVCGYYAIKQLPLSIVGPINATRPVMTLVGALLVFGESLNSLQWVGVLLAVFSIILLSRSGRKEGIRFSRNRWVLLLFAAAIFGASSGLYDKYLMSAVSEGGEGLNRLFVQAWYNLYQALLMTGVMLMIWWPTRRKTTRFRFRGSIILIALFLTAADLAYFYALSLPGALIAVISMARRSSVLVSFVCAALFFHEKNLKSKAFDLVLILIGMLFLYFGTT